MFYSIDISEEFLNSLEKILDYVFRFSFSLETSKKTYNEIMSSIYWLSLFPSRFQKFNDKYLVMTIKWKYRVFYFINESKKEVNIYDIFTSKQNYIEDFNVLK